MSKPSTPSPGSDSGDADVHATAVALFDQGELSEALAVIDAHRRADATDVRLLNLAAVAAARLGRAEAAENYWRDALKIEPGQVMVLLNLGRLLRGSRRLAEAEALLRRALSLRPDSVQIWRELGDFFAASGRDHEAGAAYRRVLTLSPEDVPARMALGVTLFKRNRLQAAENEFRALLREQPDNAEAHYKLGRVLHQADRGREAEQAYERASRIAAGHIDALNNLAVLRMRRDSFKDAESALRQVLDLSPDNVRAHANLGKLLLTLRRYPEAEASLRRALEISPGYPKAAWNLGLLLLSAGNMREGWSLYEARSAPEFKGRIVIPPAPGYSRWRGESLRGCSISVWCEQGAGDAIQFVRYLSALRDAGAESISLVCPQALTRLFELSGLADRVVNGEQARDLPAHDYWVLMLSIPGLMATTSGSIPAKIPYLKAPTLPAADALSGTALRVGLVWRGNADHENDHHRSIFDVNVLAPLLGTVGADFFSLQVGGGQDGAAVPPPAGPIVDLAPHLGDFADTAAYVARMDLILCVDSAVAHLAAALGVRCWLMLPYLGADWRWFREGGQSPWYPGVMSLFRQPGPGDWAGVVRMVARDLSRLARQHGGDDSG